MEDDELARQDTVEKVKPALAGRCVGAHRWHSLDLARIDLRLAADGDADSFELNPSPGYSYYEAHTRQPKAAAINLRLAGRTS